MNEKVYAKAQRSFDHDNVRRSKKTLAFAVEKSLFTQFEANHFVRTATDEEIAEAKAAAASAAAPLAAAPVGGSNDEDPTDPLQPEDPENPKPPLTAGQFIDGNIPDVTARIEGASPELLKAALDAESAKGEKARKGVIDALTAALAA